MGRQRSVYSLTVALENKVIDGRKLDDEKGYVCVKS